MGKPLTILILLLVGSLLFFTVFAETQELPLTAPPPLHHSHSPHHHHHHHLSPSPTLAAPALPPHHHHYPPTHAPAKPPTNDHHHHHHHHHHPPTPSPAPTIAPVPVHPHVHPPSLHPPPTRRSFVVVEGLVYTMSCNYSSPHTLSGATPLLGAVVKLECNNTRYRLVETGKSDKKGYFYLQAPKTITNFGAHKCKVFLVNAPNGLKPSNLHGGLTGSTLKPLKPFMSHKLPFLLYKVGPFAFQPKCPHH